MKSQVPGQVLGPGPAGPAGPVRSAVPSGTPAVKTIFVCLFGGVLRGARGSGPEEEAGARSPPRRARGGGESLCVKERLAACYRADIRPRTGRKRNFREEGKSGGAVGGRPPRGRGQKHNQNLEQNRALPLSDSPSRQQPRPDAH